MTWHKHRVTDDSALVTHAKAFVLTAARARLEFS
jgi:hypothetical protein